MLRVTTLLTGVSVAGGGMNVLHFEGSGAGNAESCRTAAVNFWNAIGVLGNATNSAATQGDVEEVDPTSGNITDVFPGATVVKVFQNSGEVLPQSLQALVRVRTGIYVGGREVRGRIFIPGLSEAQSATGNVLDSTRTAIQTACNALIGSAPTRLGVYSRTHHVFHPAANITVWDKFAVLRGRRD